MEKSLNDGAAFEKVESAYQSKGNENEAENTSAMLLSKTSRAFPTGTFDEIIKIQRNKAGVFNAGKYIFLVQRVGEFSDKAFYEENRDDCAASCRHRGLYGVRRPAVMAGPGRQTEGNRHVGTVPDH